MLFRILLIISSYSLSAFYSTEVPQGFLWYSLILKKKEEASHFEEIKTPRAINEALSKDFEDAIHVAIENPTMENIQKAKRLQDRLMQRAEAFSKAWVLTSLIDGSLYDREINPNMRHRNLLSQEKNREREEYLKNLSSNYGLFLIFKEDCKYCHSFLPIIQEFQNIYGFDLMAVSKSGAKLPGIRSLKDNGMIQKLNQEGIYPALFLAHFKSGQIFPISWGISSISDLEEQTFQIAHYIEKEKSSKSGRGIEEKHESAKSTRKISFGRGEG